MNLFAIRNELMNLHAPKSAPYGRRLDIAFEKKVREVELWECHFDPILAHPKSSRMARIKHTLGHIIWRHGIRQFLSNQAPGSHDRLSAFPQSKFSDHILRMLELINPLLNSVEILLKLHHMISEAPSRFFSISL